MNNTIEYLNNSVWATIKSSPVHGVGVFAIRPIPKGQKYTDSITTFAALIIRLDYKEFSQLHRSIKSLILDRCLVHKDEYIDFMSPNAQVDLRAFMNHSSTPNTDGFVTLRRIKKGEELTEDYTSFGELSTISKKHYDSFL